MYRESFKAMLQRKIKIKIKIKCQPFCSLYYFQIFSAFCEIVSYRFYFAFVLGAVTVVGKAKRREFIDKWIYLLCERYPCGYHFTDIKDTQTNRMKTRESLVFTAVFFVFFFSYYFIYLAIGLANITNHFRENWSIFHCCKLFEKCLLFNRYRCWIRNAYRLSSGGKSSDDNGIYHVPSKHWNERNALIFMKTSLRSIFDTISVYSDSGLKSEQ